MEIMQGADCCWHIAAAVGPYHPEEVYTKVASLFLELAIFVDCLIQQHNYLTLFSSFCLDLG
jgi:hypothetical protein